MRPSCDDLFKINVQVKFDQKTFIEQRQLWQDSNVKDYQYQLSAILIEYDKINYKYYSAPNIAVDGTFHYEITNFNKLDY